MGGTISSYEALEIRLNPAPKGSYLVALRFPNGETTVTLEKNHLERLERYLPQERTATSRGFHFVPREGTRDLGWSTPTIQEDRTNRSAEEIGRDLYSLLFQGGAEKLLDEHLKKISRKAHQGLCIRLHFNLEDRHQVAFALLPWELLFREQSGNFLAQDAKTPIVRFLEMAHTPGFKLPKILHILLVVSEPMDLPPLEGLTREVETIQASWEQDNVTIDVLRFEPGARFDLGLRLREFLRQKEIHILHFMGHGTFDETAQEGALYMESADRCALKVPGESFGGWLINHHSLRLVVLNACSTGRLEDERPFAGVASALLRAGVPGVLAMQAPMPDAMAVEFGRVLYHQLAAGAPLEAALSEARNRLRNAPPPHSHAWSTPVLLERTPQVVEVPPKIGPILTFVWTASSSVHLLWAGTFSFQQVLALPNLDLLVDRDVGAFLGVFFGLPLYYAALYCAMEFAKTIQIPNRASSLSLPQGISLRLPVAFNARLLPSSKFRTAYQFFFLLLFAIVPMGLQIHLFLHMLEAEIWLQRAGLLFTDSWQENLLYFVPLVQAISNDRYRLGNPDPKPGTEELIDSVTYFPFWIPWGFLLAEVFALLTLLYLLRRLVKSTPPGRETS